MVLDLSILGRPPHIVDESLYIFLYTLGWATLHKQEQSYNRQLMG